MRTEAERKRVCDFIMQIESEFNEGTIKQLVCVLISRLLNPMAAEDAASMMLAFSQAEQLEDKTVH
tara:strand:+ start:732 stop:929 length:198 start_codon:yes stop_codon:yes gene_type:complete